MNKIDIDTIIFILHRDYEEYGYNDYIDRTIRKLTRELIQERVIHDKKLMSLL